MSIDGNRFSTPAPVAADRGAGRFAATLISQAELPKHPFLQPTGLDRGSTPCDRINSPRPKATAVGHTHRHSGSRPANLPPLATACSEGELPRLRAGPLGGTAVKTARG